MDICRTCLTEESVEKDIAQLSEELNGDKNSNLDVMLFCLNIQVSADSKVTTKLCIKCYMKIISFHKFKTLALKSDAYLKCLHDDNKYKAFVPDNIKYEEMYNGKAVDALCKVEKIDSVEFEIKTEDLQDFQSDDELLSVIKKIKYEFIPCESTDKDNTPPKAKQKVAKIRKRNREMERRPKICEECGKTVVNLKEHMALHKPVAMRKRYMCKVCDKTFASYSARHRHHKSKHLGIKQRCEECGKAVTCLQSHRQVIHNNGNLPFECSECDRRFLTQSKMNMHMLIHTKDRPFPCDQCDKTFRTKIGLFTHTRQVHEKEKSHLCQYCSKRFFKRYNLQVHLRSHSKEKPYECPDCGKFFSSTTVLKNHRMIHNENKNFICDLCDMAFKKPGYLRNHMISHTKEKRYSCRYCGMAFGRSDHRLRHERNSHKRFMITAP